MKANIVALTVPLFKVDGQTLSAEQFIEYQARVSSPQNQDHLDDAFKLLRFCLRKGHWSPFDMVDVTFEIETSRAIMHQLIRHWSFRLQEFSQRYADPQAAGLGFEPVEIRLKHDKGNRQGSGEADNGLTMEAQEIIAEAGHYYASLIERGAAPESARFALTLATTTRAYVKGSVRSLITYFWQRRDKHAQQEHRDLANEMFSGFKEHFPVIAAITDAGKSTYVESEKIKQAIRALEDSGCIGGPGTSIKYLQSLIE